MGSALGRSLRDMGEMDVAPWGMVSGRSGERRLEIRGLCEGDHWNPILEGGIEKFMRNIVVCVRSIKV